jgi:hypothetical protein
VLGRLSDSGTGAVPPTWLHMCSGSEVGSRFCTEAGMHPFPLLLLHPLPLKVLSSRSRNPPPPSPSVVFQSFAQ